MPRIPYPAICIAVALSCLPQPAAAAARTDSLSSIASGIPAAENKQPHTRAEADHTRSGTEADSGVNPAAETETEYAFPAAADIRTETEPAASAYRIPYPSADEIRRLVNPFSAMETEPDDSGTDGSDASGAASGGTGDSGQNGGEELQTEADTQPDTEADLPAAAAPAESNAVIGADTNAPAGQASETAAAASDPSQSLHSLFRTPSVRDSNPARVSLYDYRMLRDYPLSSLPRDLHTLYDRLGSMVADYSGTWSVYVEDLSTRQALIVGDQPMKSASVMKLFVMAAVYDRIDQGLLERTDETVSLLHDMISNSSNEAANRLLLKLGEDDYADGIAAVNRYIASHGYSSGTHEYNGFEDAAAVVDGSHFNQITAMDTGLLLERIYSRDFLSRKVCNEIENMMLNQATRYKIPRGLPDGVEVANKTGEMDTVENDAAVVYGEKTDFILVVLSEDWDSKNTAQEEIQDIAGVVYSYLN